MEDNDWLLRKKERELGSLGELEEEINGDGNRKIVTFRCKGGSFAWNFVDFSLRKQL
ncbi:MAG: hypothetical protein ACTS4U_01770 [Candidatus Hodgkinia cicadicola]